LPPPAIKPDMQALAKKYDKVAYDVTTTKGMEAAKAALGEAIHILNK
jgi:hypothetical protein